MNLVPNKILRPVLERLIYPSGIEEDGRLEALADVSGVDLSNLYHILGSDRKSCEFDVADRLLCALNAPHAWREAPLSEWYMETPLLEKCAAPLCSRYFPALGSGPTRQRYCSAECRIAAANVRQGKSGRRTKRRGEAVFCKNGHRMTPENTIPHSASGKNRCRRCKNEANLRYVRKLAAA